MTLNVYKIMIWVSGKSRRRPFPPGKHPHLPMSVRITYGAMRGSAKYRDCASLGDGTIVNVTTT